jgi:predicted phosphodiesterase
MEAFFKEIEFMNVKIQLYVLYTDKIKDKLLCFGDFQECETSNKEIFNYCLNIFVENGYSIFDSIFISSGDMYGESYYNLKGEYIKVKGCSGIPNYDLGYKLYYVLGNHDLPLKSNTENIIEINGIHILNNGTSLTGIHGIYSKKYPDYNKSVKSLKFADLVVTHDIPKEELCNIKCNIHMFGHYHYNWGWKMTNNKLLLNTDSRFILVIPTF